MSTSIIFNYFLQVVAILRVTISATVMISVSVNRCLSHLSIGSGMHNDLHS